MRLGARVVVTGGLVLSLFPGIGLLDRAFEEEGFCVVRGPDLIWGGDIHSFHPPMDRFEGIIGGPPCQPHSALAQFGTTQAVDLTMEYLRCVDEAWPDWFLMENVVDAPEPIHDSYAVTNLVLDNRWFGGEQSRRRRFSFGVYCGDGWREPVDLGRYLDVVVLEAMTGYPTVTSAHGGNGTGRVKMRRYSLEEAARLQGLPDNWLKIVPFRHHEMLKAVANGVPLPLGRGIARAVKQAVALGMTT